jgi:hypothetical protein
MLASGCVDPEDVVDRETVDLDHLVSEGAVVSVSSPNGDVRVGSSRGDRVEVHAVKESWGGERQFDLVDIVFVGNESVLSVEVVIDPRAMNVAVALTVTVPDIATLASVSAENGAIDVTGTRGDATLTTLNGWVTAEGIDGFVTISTLNGRVEVLRTTGVGNVSASNGGLRLDVQAIAGNVTLGSINGAVSVSVSPDIDADVVITNTNGLIQFHDTVLHATLEESHRVEGTVGAGGPTMTVSAVNGDVYFYELN